MRKIFIADAHLRMPHDANYDRLLHFLRTLEGNTATLFILGDLFEFWIGYPVVAFSHYEPVIEALRRLRAAGTDIVYFEGNHDFHMGPVFTRDLRARVFTGPAILALDEKKVCLCHGDQINERDRGYRLLRTILHSGLTRSLTRVVPPATAAAIARFLGERSRANHGTRRQRWDFAALLRQYAAARFAAGCDVVVTGHFHLPLLERSAGDAGNGQVLLSLGDWITHYSYGEMVDGRIALKTFLP
jgi:UDP-2,3-diacylglucosamine hydrolase